MGDVLRSLPGAIRSPGGYRARWGVVDQSISSLSNFAITAVVAHQVSSVDFGSFSIALAVYIVCLWVARSVAGEPFVIRFTEAPTLVRATAAPEAVGVGVLIGALSGAAMIVTGLFLGHQYGGPLEAMGLFMPGLLAQDTYRYILMACGRVRTAAANDGVWLCLQSGAFILLVLSDHGTAVGLTAAFGAAGTFGALVGWRQTSAAPSLGAWRRWVRAHRDLAVPFVVELVTVNGATQLSMLGVAALGGVVAAGELRAAILLLSVPTVLCSGMYLIGVPEAVRIRHRSLHRLNLFVVILGATMPVIVCAWTGLLLLIPSSTGRALLGSSWLPGRHVLLPVAIMTAASSAIIAALVGLRALEAARQSLRVRVWAGPVIVVSAILGASAGGGYGAAIGLAGSSWFSALLAFVAFSRAMARERSKRSGDRSSVEFAMGTAFPAGQQ